jgi:hypothetical protein
MTVSMKRCLPARKSWPPDFGAGERRGRHQLGDLADGVGANAVVVRWSLTAGILP